MGLFLLGLLLRARTGPRRARPSARWSGSPNPSTRAASCSSTHRAPSKGRERVSAATRRVFHGATSPVLDLRPQPGEPVPQVEGVGHQRHRRLRGDTHRGTELLRHERAPPPENRRHRARRHSHPARADPRRPRSPYLTLRWPGGGRTTRRRCWSLVSWTSRSRRSASVAASSKAESSRSFDLDRSLPCSLPPWTHSTRDHRQRNRLRNPCPQGDRASRNSRNSCGCLVPPALASRAADPTSVELAPVAQRVPFACVRPFCSPPSCPLQ